MGGVFKPLTNLFKSPVGRVVAGVATGGTSELVRAGATTLKQNTAIDSQIIDAGAGALGNTGGQVLGATTAPIAAATSATQLVSGSAVPVTAPVLGTPITPVATGPQTYQEEQAARRRAFAARQRLGDTSTRASDQLTGSLG